MVGSRRFAGLGFFTVCALFALAAGRCVVKPDDGAPDPGADAGPPKGKGGTSSGGSGMASGGSGAASAGSGTTEGGSSAGGTQPTSGGEAGTAGDGTGPGGSSGDEFFSVVSADNYVRTPPPACEMEPPASGWCVGTETPLRVPLNCARRDEVISFDANDDENCPFCAPPPVGGVTLACPDARAIYRDFVWDLVSSSCANSCDSNADCFAWEIVNACGNVVVSLRGSLDEEPISFMEEYAAAYCGECGATPQSTFIRRPEALALENGGGWVPLLDDFEPRCVERQCVLARD
jgi:hypothetical protein